MQVLLDSSKQNTTALRYFIKYEVLQKKPIWESYKTFCQALGDETMDYSEFEFWYWRFYNGELDMDYDRKQDSTPLELMQLPLEMVEKVTEFLNPNSRVAVRNASKTLQTIVDSRKVKIERVYLRISETTLVLVNSEGIASLEKMRLRPQQELNLIISYLRQLLKHPKSELAQFCLLLDHCPHSPHPSLKNLNQIKFNVKALSIESPNPVSFKEIFSLFQPGVLEHIEIDNCGNANLNFQELSDTEHFRHAKSIDLSRVGTIGHVRQVDFLKATFSHFSNFYVSIHTILVTELILLKEHFQQLTPFKQLILAVRLIPFDNIRLFEELAMFLGVTVQEDGKVLGPIPGKNDYMEFSFQKSCIQMERKYC